jgi:exopolyphosphatase/guanosine-5'-triphosphate,3'-diphosphate pyrophosphatase
MKIAAIDIGTNSIHMVIVRVEEHRIFEIVDREKEMVMLGKNSLLSGRLAEDSIQRGLSALKTLKTIADSHGVDHIIASATSAVREARNGRDFIAQVKRTTGLDVQILSGTEEARLITLAVRDFVDLKDRKALICDIGGGSMELIVADARHIYYSESVKAGVIRLTERFILHDPPSSQDLKKLSKWLNKKLNRISRKIQDLGPEIAIGTSGTILAMGQMITERRKTNKTKTESDIININEVEEINEELQASSVEARLKVPGLDKKRVEQIVAGGILLESVLEASRMNEITLCDRALREGLIANYLIRETPAPPARMQARELRSKSVLNLLNRWEIDKKHAEHTSRLALQLFDALEEIHGYGSHERELLEYSSLLHDIGRVISYPDHHTHGWYIIKNSNLIGFQAAEIDILANTVAYHRNKKPKKKDPYLRGLKKRYRRTVRFLSSILRVADALDRQHNAQIRRIAVSVENPKHVAIALYSTDAGLIPLRAAVQKADMLQKVLKIKQLEFRVERELSRGAKAIAGQGL